MQLDGEIVWLTARDFPVPDGSAQPRIKVLRP